MDMLASRIMTQQEQDLIRESFRRYAEVLFQINNDLSFWNVQFTRMIDEFVSNDIDASRQAFDSGFYVYDIPYNSPNGWLKRMNFNFTKNIEDMPAWYKDFFGRTINLYIAKAFNEMELVLLEVIQIIYFPNITRALRDRNYFRSINRNIKKDLESKGINPDSRNDKHIIEFLKTASPEFATFSDMPVRVNLTHTWADLFDFVAILRNASTHFRSIVTTDGLNELRGKYQEFLDLFLIIVNIEKQYFGMVPKEHDNLWGMMNDFTANTIKIISGKNNLDFLA